MEVSLFPQYLLSVGQTVYFLGMTLGVFLVGLLTDRLGRKPALVAVVATVGAFGAATAFAPSFPVFLVARFLTALGAIGVLVVLTTFMLEIVSGAWTSVVGIGLVRNSTTFLFMWSRPPPNNIPNLHEIFYNVYATDIDMVNLFHFSSIVQCDT